MTTLCSTAWMPFHPFAAVPPFCTASSDTYVGCCHQTTLRALLPSRPSALLVFERAAPCPSVESLSRERGPALNSRQAEGGWWVG